MNTKRLSVILIAVAFTLVVLFSCVAVFSVKKVDAEFAVASGTDVSEVEKTLDKYLGKNLLFLKTEDIENALKEHHLFKVLNIEKQYPNVLKIKLEERRETYYLEHDEKVYVTTSEGFVLKVIDKAEYQGNTERDKITLKVKKIDIDGGTPSERDAMLDGAQIGETISMQGDEFLSTVFKLAKKVNLTDCIKELAVEKIVNGTVVFARDIVITTYTGVKIRIMDADNKGEEKIEEAFIKYDGASTDYMKTFNYILASVAQGKAVAEWSEIDNSPLANA
ncbi:MAG: FtsQ-type POTRA domain-containing protein [Clostridia bacterium]|nr:FtsQ-type POTRA domain-containing protein [Clostridia bacterium]